MSQWWRVSAPVDAGFTIGASFMVLVICGRVAACSGKIVKIGQKWTDTRTRLEGAKFACVMVSD